MDKSTPTKSLYGYFGAFPDFHIVSHCAWCPRVLEKISKIPKNYIKNIHAKKYPKLYSQHPFWGTWMPWGGPGGSKSSEGLRRGFFAPNRKVQKPNIVCIYPINNSPVVKIENFEISTLSPPPYLHKNLSPIWWKPFRSRSSSCFRLTTCRRVRIATAKFFLLSAGNFFW